VQSERDRGDKLKKNKRKRDAPEELNGGVRKCTQRKKKGGLDPSTGINGNSVAIPMSTATDQNEQNKGETKVPSPDIIAKRPERKG